MLSSDGRQYRAALLAVPGCRKILIPENNPPAAKTLLQRGRPAEIPGGDGLMDLHPSGAGAYDSCLVMGPRYRTMTLIVVPRERETF